MEAIKKDFYTYEDYCKFNDEKRREIINGVIYLLASPIKEHEDILSNLFLELGGYLKSKKDEKCKIYTSFDVRLPKENETKETASNVVRPDIFIVCDEKKLTRRGCVGAPDLVIEILSPSTGKKDKTEKFNLYQEHGVKEYWVVDPYSQVIDRFLLDEENSKYKQAETFGTNDTIGPAIFPDFKINLDEIFPPLDVYED